MTKVHMFNPWQAALDNMPMRKGRNVDGRWGGLARLLGYKIYSKGGHYCGHNTIFHNWQRGSVPRNSLMRERFMKLAGPNGKLIAWLALTKLGIAHRYVKPEAW